MQEKNNSLNNGITLIALTVTIIIMIILATITLNATIGDNGLITRTVNTKTAEELKQAQEEVEGAVKRKDYYAVSGADTGVNLSYFADAIELQRYISGRVNGAISINGKVSKVYYTNDIGSFTITFDEKGASKIVDGILIEDGSKNEVLVVGNNETITLATNNDVVHWYSTDESIIKVDELGQVTRLKSGRATIYGVTGDAAKQMIETQSVDLSKMSIRIDVYDESATAIANTSSNNPNVISDEVLGIDPSGGSSIPGGSVNNNIKLHCGNNCYAQVLNGDTAVFYVDKSVRVRDSDYGEIALDDSEDDIFDDDGIFTLGNEEIDKKITKIVFNEGISDIDADLGINFINCKEIVIPKTVKYIDINAFWDFGGEDEEIIEGITNCEKLVFNSSYNVIQDIYTEDQFHLEITFTGTEIIPYFTAISPIGIKEIEIGPDVTTLNTGVFSYCRKLKSIYIPSNVKEIKDRCFYACHGLQNVYFDNGISIIGREVFSKCTGLYDLSLPNSLKELGDGAFSSCVGLQSINIKSVERIGKQAFQDCVLLREFTFPENVKYIDNNVLTYCQSLEIINYNAINADFNSEMNFNENGWIFAFQPVYYCNNCLLKVINIGKRVKRLPDCIFANIPSIEEINFSSGIETIGSGTFMNNLGITSIHIPSSVKTVGIEAFAFNTSLVNISIENGIEEIKPGAFYRTGIKSIVIPESLKEIGRYVFGDCNKLTTIYYNAIDAIYKNGVQYDENHTRVTGAFPLCDCRDNNGNFVSYVENVIIGDKVRKIPNGLFSWMSKLESISFPDSVKTIGEAAFLHCEKIITVNLNKVEVIEGYSFVSCRSIVELTIPETVTDMGPFCFEHTNSLQVLYYNAIHCTGHFTVYYPDENVYYDLYPFYRANNSQGIISNVPNIIIGDKVEHIPKDIFRHAGITDITIPSNVITIEYEISNSKVDGGPFTSCTELNKIIVNKPENSILGAPWSNRTDIQVIWNP